jgi:glutamate racemase
MSLAELSGVDNVTAERVNELTTKVSQALVNQALPIGVFDSGVGGLTVLRALQATLPAESFVYLGDTARLPYGTKSPDTIVRYSLQAAAFLLARGIKCLVIACNTASATALEVLQRRYPDVPVIGVVEPGAAAGCASTHNGRIAVIATEGTVQGGAYQRAIVRIRPDAQVVARACPLFVPLAEEGWVNGAIVSAVAHRYLDDIFDVAAPPDTLLLGCTHFPVFREVLQTVIGKQVEIVDSADTTAAALRVLLGERNLLRDRSTSSAAAPGEARVTFMATDGCERFARVAAHFLDQGVAPAQVELIDPMLPQT